MTKILILSIFILITFGLIFSRPETMTAPTSKLTTAPKNIDYYLKETQQMHFKTTGELDFTLKSSLIEHHIEPDMSSMQIPSMLIKRKSDWQIDANLGEFFHPDEQVIFTQNVNFSRIAKNDPLSISGNEIKFDIKQDLAISKSPVKVFGKNWFLNAQSMTMNMTNEIHQFTSVNARYRHEPSS